MTRAGEIPFRAFPEPAAAAGISPWLALSLAVHAAALALLVAAGIRAPGTLPPPPPALIPVVLLEEPAGGAPAAGAPAPAAPAPAPAAPAPAPAAPAPAPAAPAPAPAAPAPALARPARPQSPRPTSPRAARPDPPPPPPQAERAPEAPPAPPPEAPPEASSGSAATAADAGTASAAAPAGGGGGPARVFGSGEVDRAVRVLEQPAPAYPARARRLGREADREVAVVVGPDGRVLEARVVGGRGDEFDREALEGVRRWRFAPALRNGAAVASHARVLVRFRLER